MISGRKLNFLLQTGNSLPRLSFLFFLEVDEYVNVAENTNFCNFDNIFPAAKNNLEIFQVKKLVTNMKYKTRNLLRRLAH